MRIDEVRGIIKNKQNNFIIASMKKAIFLFLLTPTFFLGYFLNTKAVESFPDLIVAAVVVDPQTLLPTVTYTNQGTKSIPVNFTLIAYYLNAQGTIVGTTNPSGSHSGGLAPGASATRALTTQVQNFVPPADAVKVRVLVDAANTVVEQPPSGETNNTQESLVITKDTTTSDLLRADEDVAQQDTEQQNNVLPGTLRYALKNIGRELGTVFTFDAGKKVERRRKIINEKLFETAVLLQQGEVDRAVEHLKNLERDAEKIKDFVLRLEQNNPEQRKNFAEQLFGDQIQHQVIFGKFERSAPANILKDVKDARAKSLDRMKVAADIIENPGQIQALVERTLNNDGSPFKPLRNLEILKVIEDNVPEQAKDAIRLTQDNAFKRFKKQFEDIPEETRKLLPAYVTHAGGNEAAYLKVFDGVKLKGITQEANEQFLVAKENLFLQFEERARELQRQDPNLMTEFLGDLDGGSVENLRVLHDVARNISSELVPYITATQKTALADFKKHVENLGNVERQEFLAKQFTRAPDLTTLEIYQEEGYFDARRGAVVKDLKENIVLRMKANLEEAKDAEGFYAKMRTMAGESPEQISITQEMQQGLGRQLTDKMLNAQSRFFEERMKREATKDPERAKLFEEQVKTQFENRGLDFEKFRTRGEAIVAPPSGSAPRLIEQKTFFTPRTAPEQLRETPLVPTPQVISAPPSQQPPSVVPEQRQQTPELSPSAQVVPEQQAQQQQPTSEPTQSQSQTGGGSFGGGSFGGGSFGGGSFGGGR